MAEKVSDFWQEQAKLLRGQKRPSKDSQGLQDGSGSVSKAEDVSQSRDYNAEALLAPLEEGESWLDEQPIQDQVYTFQPILPAVEEPYKAKALASIAIWEGGYIWLFVLGETGEKVRKRIAIVEQRECP